MRIIAGRYGGRNFESPHGYRTHPMSEKIRGAIFNTLGDIEGLSVLDAYAGTGALGLEAISRGAVSVVALDNDKGAYSVIKKNAASLGVEGQLKVINTYAESWSTRFKDSLFDLVFLDPPYDLDMVVEAEKLAKHACKGGIVVFSLPPKSRVVLSQKEYVALNSKVYGDATLYFYRKI